MRVELSDDPHWSRASLLPRQAQSSPACVRKLLTPARESAEPTPDRPKCCAGDALNLNSPLISAPRPFRSAMTISTCWRNVTCIRRRQRRGGLAPQQLHVCRFCELSPRLSPTFRSTTHRFQIVERAQAGTEGMLDQRIPERASAHARLRTGRQLQSSKAASDACSRLAAELAAIETGLEAPTAAAIHARAVEVGVSITILVLRRQKVASQASRSEITPALGSTDWIKLGKSHNPSTAHATARRALDGLAADG